MKKLLFVLTIVFGMFAASNANASNYRIDDSNLDTMFSKAVSTVMVNFQDLSSDIPGMGEALAPKVKGKDPLAAILLNFFLGGFGIHRFYLGTETMTGIGYILTCGGIFGVVPLVDLIVLAVNYNDIGQFVDNPKFFMW